MQEKINDTHDLVEKETADRRITWFSSEKHLRYSIFKSKYCPTDCQPLKLGEGTRRREDANHTQ